MMLMLQLRYWAVLIQQVVSQLLIYMFNSLNAQDNPNSHHFTGGELRNSKVKYLPQGDTACRRQRTLMPRPLGPELQRFSKYILLISAAAHYNWVFLSTFNRKVLPLVCWGWMKPRNRIPRPNPTAFSHDSQDPRQQFAHLKCWWSPMTCEFRN